METSTFDSGTVVILAAVLLVVYMAVRNWIGNQKPRSVPEGKKPVPMQEELRDTNASLAQLTTIIHQQQAAIDKNTQTLQGMRRSLEDQAGAGKSALERISGAVDAARSEAAARDEATRKLIGDVHSVAAAAGENAENALLTAGGLRRKLDEVGTQVENIPPLRNDIQQLQQNVTAIAEAMPKPTPEQRPAPTKEEQPKPAREKRATTSGRHDKRSTRKTGGKQQPGGRKKPAGEATPAAEPPETDAAASAGAEPQTGATPPEHPAAATSAPDPEPEATTTPNGETGASRQQAAEDAAARTNGKPSPAAQPAAGTTTADAVEAGDGSAAGGDDDDTATTGATVTENGDDAGNAPPAASATNQTEATQ